MSNHEMQCARDGHSDDIKEVAYITMLPNELILSIAENLSRNCDLNSFLRCNRRFHSLLNQQLYRLDAQSPGNDSLWWAIKTADVDLAKRAIDAGSDPNKKRGSRIWVGHRPLLVAVLQAKNTHKRKIVPKNEPPDFLERNDNLIRYLVSRKVDMNLDHFQDSPLRHAVFNGEITTVRLLLDNGADVSIQDCRGGGLAQLIVGRAQKDNPNSPIYFQILKLLLEHGLDPNAGNRWKFTPLHQQIKAVGTGVERAKRKNYKNINEERVEDVLKLLLKHGADIDAQDHFGETPLSLALDCLHDEPICLTLLLQYGADTSLVSLPSCQEKREAALKVCEEVSQATGKTFKFRTE
ncbi:uncharacterized protein GIQ15_04510 [Arthroderma uncinatum]|uniref:uncharacterized protein n=1 Tax=Arthroderma uncinatum TaxID=74035 RepID=UPI00144AA07A|nr:uncharacterized protein GIQ15_04510 [Arthroderma uncinatum]KAF3481751.1 hypothetical protein GIQ15_04510 [Arthroderma uncinatum]